MNNTEYKATLKELMQYMEAHRAEVYNKYGQGSAVANELEKQISALAIRLQLCEE